MLTEIHVSTVMKNMCCLRSNNSDKSVLVMTVQTGRTRAWNNLQFGSDSSVKVKNGALQANDWTSVYIKYSYFWGRGAIFSRNIKKPKPIKWQPTRKLLKHWQLQQDQTDKDQCCISVRYQLFIRSFQYKLLMVTKQGIINFWSIYLF